MIHLLTVGNFFSGGDNSGRTKIASQFAVMQSDGFVAAHKANRKEKCISWFFCRRVCHASYLLSTTRFLFLNMY